MSISSCDFGSTVKGETATLYTITNADGCHICVTDYGAALVSVKMPDQNGQLTDVILGYSSVEGYEADGNHFGATVGRNGNRIGGASFILEGVTYTLAKNDNGINNLHSGPDFYGKRFFGVKVHETENTVVFALHSPDQDQGFPGNFDVTVSYTLTDSNEIHIAYDGISDADTIANMTNHTYFNLGGHGSGDVLDHVLWLDADHYTPAVDGKLIPTGEICPVEGTPFDFIEEKPIGRDINDADPQLSYGQGYDHNFMLNGEAGTMRLAARVVSPKSGIIMEVITDCPGVQLYTGNCISVKEPGKEGVIYGKNAGFCLETQCPPNAVNAEAFATPLLKKNERYCSETIYRFI